MECPFHRLPHLSSVLEVDLTKKGLEHHQGPDHSAVISYPRLVLIDLLGDEVHVEISGLNEQTAGKVISSPTVDRPRRARRWLGRGDRNPCGRARR